MGHGKHKGYGFRKEPPVPVADYNVTGNPDPDCRCNYFVSGTYDGKPYYRREDGSYFIWWNSGPGYWIISTVLGVLGADYWFKSIPITGDYFAAGGASGTATVAAGPH